MEKEPKIHLLIDSNDYWNSLLSTPTIAQVFCQNSEPQDRVTNFSTIVNCPECFQKANQDFGKHTLVLTDKSARSIGNHLSIKAMGIHSVLPDSWEDSSVKWSIVGDSLMKIQQLIIDIKQECSRFMVNTENLKFTVE